MNNFTQLVFAAAVCSAAVMPARAELSVTLNEFEPINLGESITLSIDELEGNGPFTYQWTNRDGEVVGSSESLTVTPTRPEVYHLVVSNETESANAYAEVVVYGVKENATFEDIALNEEKTWSGRIYDDPAQMESNFFSGGFMFTNTYMPAWLFWGGFAASARTETSFDSATYLVDQFNCVAGSGHESAGFGLVYTGMCRSEFTTLADRDGATLSGVYVSNNMYFINSATAGDAYAKPFTDGDFHKIVFTGDDPAGSPVEFYLADFTGTDHYIVRDWRWVDLSALGKVKTVTVSIESSNEMVPTYACLDDLTYADNGGISDATLDTLDARFTASGAWLEVSGAQTGTVDVYNTTGMLVASQATTSGRLSIETSALPHGVYIVAAQGATIKVVK